MTRLQVQVSLVYDIVLRLNIVRIPLGGGVRVCLLACVMGGATRVPALCFRHVFFGSFFSSLCLFPPCYCPFLFRCTFFLSLSRCCPLPTFWFVVLLVGLPPFLLVLFVPASVPLVALSLFFFCLFSFLCLSIAASALTKGEKRVQHKRESILI